MPSIGSAPPGSPRSPPSFLPNVPQLEKDYGRQHREEEERDGRPLPEVASVEPDLIGQRREEMGGVDGAPPREHVDDVEVAEREDRREQDHDGEDGLEERQCHVPEPAPAVRAVDLRRFALLTWN